MLLVVNTASKCGYTPQYEGLEKLYRRYGERGLVVLGFPSDDFGGQEPGSNRDIANFCEVNYGVSFPMFEKVTVKGPGKAPVYQWLTDPAKNGWNEQEPLWNFCKYVINEKGELTHFFPSKTLPESPEFREAVGL